MPGHAQRKLALEEFDWGLSQDRLEEYWQDYFERNTWIFGYGLNYQFRTTITPQPNVGGASIKGRGAHTPDFLQRTEADVKFTVLVEIKRPDTSFFEISTYRSAVPMPSKDLTGGVAQLQNACIVWEGEGSRTDQSRELLPGDTYTFQPKGILVIGNTVNLDGLDEKRTFELYRRNLINPEIITFDELYARAKFILARD